MDQSTGKKRKASGDDEAAKDKRRQKKWTVTEEIAIADYISEHYERYKVSSKSTFVRKLRDDLQLDCEDEKQLINKLSSMECKYKGVKLESGKKGEGLTEGTAEYGSWEGYVKGKCHFFFILDRVMTTRANIQPPFDINSSEQVDIPEDDPVADAEFQEQLMESQIFGLPASPDPETVQVAAPSVTQPKLTSGTKKAEKRKFYHKIEKGAGSGIAEAMKMQAEISSQHFQRLDDCKMLELNGVQKKLDLERDRLQFEKDRDERAMQLEETKIKQNFEIEKLRMDRESEKEQNEIRKLQLQIELGKLGHK